MTQPTLMAQLVELQEENARLREDAERYRWLRDNARIGFELEDDEPVVTIVFTTAADSLNDIGRAVDEAVKP